MSVRRARRSLVDRGQRTDLSVLRVRPGAGVMLALSIPWPPSSNHLHTVARGRKILSAEGRRYYAEVAFRVREQIRWAPKFTGRLRVVFHAFTPDKHRRDLSNLLKAAEDSLTGAGVWGDDSLIDDLRIVRQGVVAGGRIDVVIESVPEARP